MMRRLALFVVFFFGALCPFIVYAAVPTEDRPVALLKVLDKVTARVESLEIPVDRPFKFGTLILTVRGCRVTPPEETPEAAAFLDITELKPGETEVTRFRGWMFASSPALSALEHPVYDVWVTGCRKEEGKGQAMKETPKAQESAPLSTPIPVSTPTTTSVRER